MKFRDRKLGRRQMLATAGTCALWAPLEQLNAGPVRRPQVASAGGDNFAVGGDVSVQTALDARPTVSALASAIGGKMVGFEQTLAGAVRRTVSERLSETVSVKDFGAVGDGTTNDRAAIQAAFDSGARKVVFPRGIYKVTGGGFTVPNWLHVAGEGYGPTAVPGDSGVCIQFDLTRGIALNCGFNPTFDNIYFTNVGGTYNESTATLSGTTASCLDLTDNVTMNYCSFAGWETCVMFGSSTFYVKTFGVEFNRCTNGYRTNGAAPYNVDIYAPISRLTTNFFAGQSAHPARNIKVHGGSIEGFTAVAFGFLDASFFGTYFETIAQRSGAIALAPDVDGASITLVGCLIYMNYIARFANMSEITNAMLTSVGNQYDGRGAAGAICICLPASGSVSVAGDRFGIEHSNGTLYVDSITNAAKFNGITFPVLPAKNTQAGYSGMALIGQRGFVAVGLTIPPTQKTTGMTVMADGDSWDPLSRAAGRPYWVIWQGDRWHTVSGA
ncbi:glycosyl hydrolase family 28-related protein [Sphingopyxis sp. EG6]|uniref:glycosyl hydrolase family 28-related protein n=1 Tax=Sphingopyxis sp. EG6 TaxID=1874061 RepID=UPI000DC64049|nr:glycosyl hydrolase family 28-related protein [Sphingopyxis sp. EG6]BBB09901.1 outer membrane autotransporter [Sphingopyxis sp. EG6]